MMWEEIVRREQGTAKAEEGKAGMCPDRIACLSLCLGFALLKVDLAAQHIT
jgi:hypothetical protein